MKRRKWSPVTAAVTQQALRQSANNLAIRVYLTDDGESDLNLLSELAFVIGLGAEVALATGGSRSLHGALRSLLAMAVDGGRWQAAQAGLMHRMVDEALALSLKHTPLAMGRTGNALWVSGRIARGEAGMDDVAGAEVYQG